MTEKLTSFYKIKGFSSLLVCSAFIFCRVMTFILYIGAGFTFGILDCVRYKEDFVISRFCYKHFTVTLVGLKNIVCYTENFVISRFVKSRFRCSLFLNSVDAILDNCEVQAKLMRNTIYTTDDYVYLKSFYQSHSSQTI